MVYCIYRTEQSQIFLFYLAIPISEKVISNIFMETIQTVNVKVREFILQSFHLVENLLPIVLSISINRFYWFLWDSFEFTH
jgi:hypothetical protein